MWGSVLFEYEGIKIVKITTKQITRKDIFDSIKQQINDDRVS